MAAFNKQVKINIEKAINHAYLEKHLQKPFVDSKKISMLRYIFEDIHVEEQKKLDFTIAVLLVQIALDTHELVPVKPQSASAVMDRQLTVLAGDYYSGLYYHLLAKSREVSFIQALASAIKNINEYKMTLYHENITSWDELINVVKQIETLLFATVARSFHIQQGKIDFIVESLFANRLLDEIVKIENNEFSYFDYYVTNNLVPFEQPTLVVQLEHEIDQCRQLLENEQIKIPFYVMEINEFIYGKNTLSAVEEG